MWAPLVDGAAGGAKCCETSHCIEQEQDIIPQEKEKERQKKKYLIRKGEKLKHLMQAILKWVS